ncbi:MAG: cytochrome c5 family protein [Pseudomonadales bacterium]
MAQEVADRTKPVGDVCVEGDPCAAQAAAAAKPSGPRSGEDIYSASCTACHAVGVSGAPKFGDAAQWAPRIAKGLDTLYANSITGINLMPAKGLCMDCSDEEIQASVDYMLDAVK